MGAEFSCGYLGNRAAEFSNRSTRGGDDNNFTHSYSP
jgi:hypothetical protein